MSNGKDIKHPSDHNIQNDNEVADDTTTIVPSVTYSRNNHSFSLGNNNNNESDTSSTNNHVNLDVDYINNNISNLQDRNINKTGKLKKEDKQLINSQLNQWNYNNNKTILQRSILQTNQLLIDISKENEKRPIYIENNNDSLYILKVNVKLVGEYYNDKNNRMDHSISSTDLTKNASNKKSTDSLQNNSKDYKLLTNLFNTKIEFVLKHLNSLQHRVNDVSSKVFITGDVNSGKSSFCNSLLKKRLLPEDQLPCTQVFCEIRDFKENEFVEEIHAIPWILPNNNNVKESVSNYDIRDKSTFVTYPINQLNDLVLQNDKFSMLKIYINDDKRKPEESLLKNGTVSISLIDSPGLNMDSIQTSEVMARQEEIDLVIFVVNAENQLTLSAKDFIEVASKEKKLIFFVIKKFDKIRDKERCKKLILQQIEQLSPETYKNANDFVHFLESPSAHYYSENNNSDDNPDGDSGNPDDYPDDNDPDFNLLDDSLRNFVLKRRSISKLLPAKTFLQKVLNDLITISQSNLKIFQNEDNKIKRDLSDLKDDVLEMRNYYIKFMTKIDSMVEATINSSYDYTKESIVTSLDISMSNIPQYEGFSKIYEFIMSTEQYIKEQVRTSIINSEQYAREQTSLKVDEIYALANEELNNDFMEQRKFNSTLMFTRNYHNFIRQISLPLQLSDLYAPTWQLFFQYLGLTNLNPLNWYKKSDSIENVDIEEIDEESTTEGDNANTAANGNVTTALELTGYPLIKYLEHPSLLFSSKIPTLAIYSIGGSRLMNSLIINGLTSFSVKTLTQISGSIIMVGSLLTLSFLIYDLPRALPINLIDRYKSKLQELDYIHANANRISREVQEVFKVPTREIVKACELIVNAKESNKIQLEDKRDHNRISIAFFQQLLQRSTHQKGIVESISLEVD